MPSGRPLAAACGGPRQIFGQEVMCLPLAGERRPFSRRTVAYAPRQVHGRKHMTAPTFDALLCDVRACLDEQLAAWLAPRVAVAAAISGEVGLAAEAAKGLALRGGKRLRAALVAAGYEAFE